MKKMFCDCCGTEMPVTTPPWPTPVGYFDLYSPCIEHAKKLDLKQVTLSALQAQLEADPPDAAPATPAPEAPLQLRGKYAKAKRDVLVAMERKRAEFGLGYCNQLAEAAKVPRDVIDDIIERKRVPTAQWEAVAKALGIDWPPERKVTDEKTDKR